MSEDKYFMTTSYVSIKEIGKRYFLVSSFFDYTKKKLPEISKNASEIISFLQQPRTMNDIYEKFGQSYGINQFLDYCIVNGYLITWSNQKDRMYISDLVRGEWSQERTFYGCTFELTPKCNFKCVHCYLDGHHQEESPLTTRDVFKIIDILSDNGLFLIFFSGGDPFVRKDFKDIYVYTRKKGIQVELFTNGSLITDDWLDVFSVFPPVEIDISLYGSCEEKYEEVTRTRGSFKKVIDNIFKLKSRGVNVSIKCPVISLLADDVENMQNLAKKLCVPFRFTFDINPTIDNREKKSYQTDAKVAAQLTKKYSEDFDKLKCNLEVFEKSGLTIPRTRYKCTTGKCSGFVDYNGRFCPCIENRKKGINLLSESFVNIWEFVKENSYEKIPNGIDYKCLSCKKITLCKNCPAVRERKYGDPLIVKEEDCKLAEELYNLIKES